MINNYLEWVKGARKSALHFAYEYRRMSQKDRTPWGTGFYAGHAQARYFESQHWRALQKDIEARKKGNYMIIAINPFNGIKYDLCEKRGGKNG